MVKEKSRNVINEAFRVVRTNLEFMQNKGSESHVIMITSANPGSGKTFISFNLATSLGIKGKRIIAIDLDLRKASLSQYAGRPKKGISDYFGRRCERHQGCDCQTIRRCQDRSYSGWHSSSKSDRIALFRTPGTTDNRPPSDNDYIFIDCPPVEIVADAAIINKLVDMTLFIVRAGLLEPQHVAGDREILCR